MRYLLDTGVISDLVARYPDPGVVAWIDSVDEGRFYLSAITIGEVKRGIDKLPDSDRKSELENWFVDDLLMRLRDKMLPIDASAMLVWGELTADLEKRGKKKPAIDSLIATITVGGELDLVTRNEACFAHTGVAIVNPWGR